MSETEVKITVIDWEIMLEDYFNSGMSRAKWCEQKGIKVNQLQWQLKKRQKKNERGNSNLTSWIQISNPEFAETGKEPIKVKIGSIEIIVSQRLERELFKQVVLTLLEIC